MTNRPTANTNRVIHSLLIACALLLTGCVERTIKITSEPPGALVYLNDQEVGRTPCETEFLYYGTYDVRLVLDGHEPYMGPGEAPTPLYEFPPIDLVAEITPIPFRNVVEWHFDLMPVDTDREAIVERARQLRAKLNPESTAEQEPVVETESPSNGAEITTQTPGG